MQASVGVIDNTPPLPPLACLGLTSSSAKVVSFSPPPPLQVGSYTPEGRSAGGRAADCKKLAMCEAKQHGVLKVGQGGAPLRAPPCWVCSAPPAPLNSCTL